MQNKLILLGEYGSVAQGTATENSDHDYMGVVIENEEEVIGLDVFKTERDSDAAEGQRSLPGSSDTTYHALRKFAALAANGNPTVGSILHLPKYEVMTDIGEALVASRDMFWSKKAGHAYLGYLNSQISALQGKRGQKRPELEAEHGYDIKFAYHAYRLGVQGQRYMTYRDPGIPMEGDQLSFAQRIREGQIGYDVVMAVLEKVESNLKESILTTAAPNFADYARINEFLVEAHIGYWEYGIY